MPGGPVPGEPAAAGPPPRLGLLDVGALDDAQRALYEAITGGPRASQVRTVPMTDESGRAVGPFAVMLLTPEVGDVLQQVGAKIRFGAELTDRERELAVLTVAGTLDCEFERLAHVPAALGVGLTREQVGAALAGRDPGGLSADEALVVRLARVMAATRTLGDADYAAGVAGLGPERLATLTWLVGYYAALALSLAVFRPELPEAFAANARRAAGD